MINSELISSNLRTNSTITKWKLKTSKQNLKLKSLPQRKILKSARRSFRKKLSNWKAITIGKSRNNRVNYKLKKSNSTKCLPKRASDLRRNHQYNKSRRRLKPRSTWLISISCANLTARLVLVLLLMEARELVEEAPLLNHQEQEVDLLPTRIRMPET